MCLQFRVKQMVPGVDTVWPGGAGERGLVGGYLGCCMDQGSVTAITKSPGVPWLSTVHTYFLPASKCRVMGEALVHIVIQGPRSIPLQALPSPRA